MQTEILIYITALFLFLLLISAWDALVHFSGGRVRRIESKDRELAKKSEDWLENKQAYESVFRFLVFITLAWIAGLSFFFIKKYTDIQSIYMIVFITILATFSVVIVSEIINEALIIRFDMALLKMTMPLIKILRYSIFFPFIFCIETLRYKIDKWQLQNDDEEERTTTEDEILSLVEQNETDGEDSSLEEDEKRMIKGVFDLDNTDVREIMTPRVDIIGINMNDSVDDALKLFIESGHSRIPVYENNMDNITGILYAKDFLNKNKVENKKLDRIARRPIFIPETKEVGDLLAEMQKARNHFSVVIDEYGGTAGIVTLEDIIEEIVGEIRDEYDVNEDDTPMHIAMSDGSVVFDARTLIDDVNDILDSHLPENEDVDTIGGFICGELGHIPRKGENLIIEDGSLKITVLQADRKKILKIKISRI
jgi:CBS domain containing-hemolysin-like protein